MKLMKWVIPTAAVWVAGFAATVAQGCEGGTASCHEECDNDDDCQGGLGCFETLSGKQCLPSECDACFDQGKSCYSDENTDEQSEGESLQCDFRECG